eukprot:scaffold1996_cov132-Isochrysis_galbana.AAC.8
MDATTSPLRLVDGYSSWRSTEHMKQTLMPRCPEKPGQGQEPHELPHRTRHMPHLTARPFGPAGESDACLEVIRRIVASFLFRLLAILSQVEPTLLCVTPG